MTTENQAPEGAPALTKSDQLALAKGAGPIDVPSWLAGWDAALAAQPTNATTPPGGSQAAEPGGAQARVVAPSPAEAHGGAVLVPLAVLEDASRALGAFVSDEGWADADMQAMDNLDAYIARHKANAAAAAKAKPKGTEPDDKALTQALEERDAASDYIDALLDEVLGADRHEWTSAYGHADAMAEVRERMSSLLQPMVDKAWSRFEAAVQAPAVQAWQPIETAPQDGTVVLAMLPDSDVPQTVRWSLKDGCWSVAFDDWHLRGRDTPTHWMPLPAAPGFDVPVQGQGGEQS